MDSHAEFITALGNGTAVAKLVFERTGEPVDREAVYKWKRNGVPWRLRYLLAEIANEKQVPVPDGFIIGKTSPPEAA